MTQASDYLLKLGRGVYEAYASLPTHRAFIVTGSAAEHKADFYSDLDMTAYYDALPLEPDLEAARQRAGGSDRLWQIGDRVDDAIAESFNLDGVECQIGHTTIAAWERDMASVLE